METRDLFTELTVEHIDDTGDDEVSFCCNCCCMEITDDDDQ